jgi:uncharacterized protein (DUF983 family)
MARFKSIIQGKCPHCEKEKVFYKSGNILLLKAPKMNKSCTNCGHLYEKELGFFYGAMYISYGFSVIEMFLLYLILYPIFENVWLIIGSLILFISLMGFVNYKYSRILWMYLFTKKKK